MNDTFARRPVLVVAVFLLLLLLVAAALLAYSTWRAQQITGQQTVLVAPDQLVPGEQAAMRAVVQDLDTGEPLSGAAVEVSLRGPGETRGGEVYRGRTDALGSADIRFVVPADLAGQQQLVVNTRSAVGSDELSKPVQIQRLYKLLLTTDKPLYQPGQAIHIRALALSAGDLQAADGLPLEFVVQDPKGNKVFREEVTTSPFGIASADFPLANEVNTGDYKVLARLGSTATEQAGAGAESEKTVMVKPYVLPKFQVNLQTGRPWYLPGQKVQGTLQASYFFGKPVSEGQVTITGSVYEVERQQVLELTGVTDAEGRFPFEFDLPEYFVSGAPEVGQAAFGLEATVIDQANQAEQVAQALVVAQEPLLIDVVAESGALKPGVENVVYILTSYPNGAPAQTEVDITGDGVQQSLTTGSAGLAELRFTPPATPGPLTLTIAARDAQGNEASKVAGLEAEAAAETVLLRPERAAYRVGDTLHVDVLSSAPQGTAYLDIVRAGQTLSTRTLEIPDGRAAADIDLDETLYGTLELHAYKVLRDASLVTDTRLVVVDRADDIDIALEMDQDTYRPGDPATISFQTTKDGQPLPAALGLSIVDESVFALQEQEAGLARLYFLLQAEILEPKYQIKGFSPAWLLAPPPGEAGELQASRDAAARATLAANPAPELSGLSLPRWEKDAAIRREQGAVFEPALAVLGGVAAALGLAGLILSLVVLVRRRQLGQAALWALAGLAVLVLGSILLYFLVRIIGDQIILVLFLAAALLSLVIGLLGLAIYAWQRGDRPLQVLELLGLAFLLLLPMLALVLSRTSTYLTGDIPLAVFGVLLGGAALLLAIYVRGAGFAAAGQPAPAALGFLAALGLPLLLVAGSAGVVVGGMAAPAAPGAFRTAGVAEEAAGFERAVEVSQEVEVPVEAPQPGQEPPRLRQFFPETLYWDPQVFTDDAGRATVQLETVADSITTWRMSVLASSQQGELGSTTAGLRVFQDFFVDLDLPLYLTQNDEVSVPVAVFNYLPQAQQVRLVVEPQEWFELLDEPEKVLTIQANDVDVVYFRIRAARFGRQSFQVTAWGETMSDAIVKEVEVLPDGKRFREVVSDRLAEGETVVDLPVPAATIPGTAKVYVKIYPGVVSQVVEGLQGMLRMPFG